MALFYPEFEQITHLKVQPTAGEYHLLTALAQYLDDSYEVYFQPFLNGDRPDIIVMRKGSGILIIEVKDWDLNNYYVQDGKWRLFQNSAHIVSPLKQVQSYKDNLFNLHIDRLLDKKLQDKNYFALVSCAVYFHFQDELQARRFCGEHHIEILGRDSMNEMRLHQLLYTCWLSRPSRYFDEHLYTNFRRYLKPPMHTIEEGKEIIYSPKQKALIESRVTEQKIRGVAGSGKTKLLAKRAVNAHLRTGTQVLVLTFNITLRNYIHDRISEVREAFGWDNFYILHYHQFFIVEANNYGLIIDGLQDFSNVDFFADVEQEIVKYDAIFIDEIQDYETTWIRIIKRYFLATNGEFVVVGDEKQNVYKRKLAEDKKPNTTIPGRWNELTDTFRSNWKVSNLAFDFQVYFLGEIYEVDVPDVVEQGDLFGEKQYVKYLDLATNATTEQIFDMIDTTVKQLDVHPNDVTVLSSKIEVLRELDFLVRTRNHESTATTFESKEDYNRLSSQPDSYTIKMDLDSLRRSRKFGFWANSGTMKLATIHSFKGWEVHTLFLIIENEASDNDETSEEFASSELIYTAITRCRQNLIVINLGSDKYRQFFQKYMPDD